MRKVNRTMGDQILCAPAELASAGVKFSEKALQVLDIHSNLNSFSQTLHDSLPNANAQISIDKFWSNWSKLILDMAVEIENIGILLANAAVLLYVFWGPGHINFAWPVMFCIPLGILMCSKVRL